MDKVIASFRGMGAKAELYKDRVIIKKSLLFGNKDKTIYLSRLSGIIEKKQGLTNPALHFALSDSKITDRKLFNREDDNTINFLSSSRKHALEFKAAVERQLSLVYSLTKNENGVVSAADEIIKYKTLLDQGVITQDEFEIKKKQLMGL